VLKVFSNKTIYFILILLGIYSCNNSRKNQYPKEVPTDFNFSLRFGLGQDEISTFDSLFFTVCMLDTTIQKSGDSAVKVVFTKEDMKRIYQILSRYDYLAIPDTIESKECMIPCGSDRLIVKANSRKKIIYSTSCCPVSHYRQVFDSIISPILQILHSKKEVRNLSPVTRIYL
jgi:hypothetical protein